MRLPWQWLQAIGVSASFIARNASKWWPQSKQAYS